MIQNSGYSISLLETRRHDARSLVADIDGNHACDRSDRVEPKRNWSRVVLETADNGFSYLTIRGGQSNDQDWMT